LAPTVTFSQNTGFGQLTIRGIGTNVVFAGSDPSSAVYVDGVYLARPAMLFADFLDLERVEVLRGPQGTLYGRNVVGGAVNLITKPPTDQFEASASFIAGDYHDIRSEARVSGPLVRGKVTGSAAILRGVRRGFVRDLEHPDDQPGGENVTAARGQLRTVFGPRADLLVSADVTHQDPIPLGYFKVLAVKPGFQVNNPADLHEVRLSTLGESRKSQFGSSARLTLDLTPSTRLTSLTAFRKLDYDLRVDADITELDLTVSHPHEKQHQVSQEVTVSNSQSRLTWVGGFFLFHEFDRQPTLVTLPSARLENLLNPRVEADTGAIFGQASFSIIPRVSLTAGLRYANEQKTIDNEGRLAGVDSPFAVREGTAYSYTDAISHDAWTPKFGVEVRARQNTFLYASATRGFKSGGFNLTSPVAGRGYAPEWAWSYEGGAKTETAGGRLRLNVAAFHTDYTDLQVQTAILPGVIDISNAAAATISGVELESAALLSPAVRIGGHLAWLDTTYDRYIAVGVGGITSDVAGNRLTNAPEWSGRAWIEWNGRMGRAGTWSLRGDSTWQTTVFYTPFNDEIQRQRAYGLLDVSAEFTPRQKRWSVGLFARNLTNQDYITGTFSSPPPAIGGRPGDPRHAGIRFSIHL
jgi:iron complex outermembrane receptor protein